MTILQIWCNVSKVCLITTINIQGLHCNYTAFIGDYDNTLKSQN